MAKAKKTAAKKATKKFAKKPPAKKAVSKPKTPLFDSVNFSGVGLIERRGRKKTLVIYASKEEALRSGMARERAEQLFLGAIAAAGGCRENWATFGGSMSCDNVWCAGTCMVQVNKYDGLGWVDHTTGTATVISSWAYRCKC